ncbi:hypothetical protein [Arcanobacterium hippocoleae]|uniref:Uncharacterized protein n=1 Tax=Arcanobacterium hippocoleae TaxID=149017 RepID=A0ABU1SZJ7_9ACTO|nr:hypothetical protein [Arcanobacterium hippocoleae]MDR6938543.1 hypothetical protein [Arcanobacterium hippocoleae]
MAGEQHSGVITRAVIAAAGIYFIPGIGEIAITVTEAILIAGGTVAVGTWQWIPAHSGSARAAQRFVRQTSRQRWKSHAALNPDRNDFIDSDDSAGFGGEFFFIVLSGLFAVKIRI